MQLFVACSKASFIIDLDEELEVLKICQIPIPIRKGNFGYAWCGNSLFAAEEIGLIEYTQDLIKIKIHQDPTAFLGRSMWAELKSSNIDRQMLASGQGPNLTQFHDPHQLITIDNKIYAIDTAHEWLRIFDAKTNTWHLPICIQDIPWCKTRNINWINSINYIDGQILLVAHNHGWSTLLHFDSDMNFLYGTENIGFLCHNVWKMNDKLWTLSSGEGCIKEMGGSAKINLGAFPRGVSLTQDNLFIGVTPIRSSKTPGVVNYREASPPRPKHNILNKEENLGIAILDPLTLGFKKYIDLLPDVLAILEIRIIGEKDFAIHTDINSGFFNITQHGDSVEALNA